MTPEPLAIPAPSGALSAELLQPASPRAALVLAHGAGAGYRHATLVAIGEALAGVGVATLRFNFPFMEAGRRRVDPRDVAIATTAAAAETLAERLPHLPLMLGGHSFGGRMASHLLAEQGAAADGHAGDYRRAYGARAGARAYARAYARALICLSFPLHPAKRPGVDRARHLEDVPVPMLFLSGTRDALADADLLAGVVRQLGSRARLHWLEDADHGYRVRKRVRRDPRPVVEEIAAAVGDFLDDIL